MKGMMTKEIILGAWKQQVFQKNRAWVENENIRGEAELMARWMNNWDSRWLALLHGNVGTGKTTLMESIIALTPEKIWHPVHAKGLCWEIQEKSSAIKEFSMFPFVAVDDVGEEPTTVQYYGNIYTPVTDFLEVRYQARKKTIITTNLQPAELQEKYGERVFSRLKEMAFPIPFLGEDFRKNT